MNAPASRSFGLKAGLGAARAVRNIMDLSLAKLFSSPFVRRRAHGLLTKRVTESSPQANVILPASYGSLGDEALYLGTLAAAKARNKRLRMFVQGSTRGWPDLPAFPMESLSRLRRGCFPLLSRRGMHRFGSSDMIMVGADTISGNYLHGFLAFRVAALTQAAANGHKAQLVNFSMSGKPTPTALDLLRTLPPTVEFWARDQRSRERAIRFLKRDVGVCPDIGALVPLAPSPRTTEWLERMNPAGNTIITLVPNAHFITLGWYTQAQIVSAWVAIGRALSRNARIVILPHDLRPRPGDKALCRIIADTLRAASIDVELFVPRTVCEAKVILANSSGVVSARMHACVSTLASGTPCVGIEYLEKFTGQFEWYGRLGTVVPLEDALDDKRIVAEARRIIRNGPAHPQTGAAGVTHEAIAWL